MRIDISKRTAEILRVLLQNHLNSLSEISKDYQDKTGIEDYLWELERLERFFTEPIETYE